MPEVKMTLLDIHKFAPRLKKVLFRMEQIASLEDMPVNLEPLILAILEQSDCDVVQTLNRLGVTEESFREAIHPKAHSRQSAAQPGTDR